MSLRIPDELDEKLTRYAKEMGLSKNQVVRMALKGMMDGVRAKTQRTSRRHVDN
jgi:antitoxin component of RelBE/YafQ-DinJ toxin-antitoxin module